MTNWLIQIFFALLVCHLFLRGPASWVAQVLRTNVKALVELTRQASSQLYSH